ncbi:MAG: cation:proton antiporter [Candidatus Micrarchaeia archaeon]
MEAALAVGISITVIMISAFIFDRLRLPHVLGVLVAGILVGPFSPIAGLNLLGLDFGTIIITDPSLVETFSVLGSALILFGIGLEFSVIRLWKMGWFTFIAALLKIGIVYFTAHFCLAAMGFGTQAAVLVAVALSFSSTPIIIKLLEDSGKIKRPEVNFIISVLVIEDLLAVFFLGLIANPVSSGEYSLAVAILRVVITFIFAYFVLSRLIDKFLNLFAHSDELIILSTVSLVLVIGYLSSAVGLSFSVGAFLAGSTIAGSQHSKRIEEKIKPFNSLFASFFFFSIGLMVNIAGVLSNLPLLFIFLAIGVFVRFAASGFASYMVGFSGRNACFCAAVFLSMSELSLMLISQGASSGILSSDFLGSFAFAIIGTSFLSAWLINRENEIYNVLQSVAPQIVIKNLRLLRSTVIGMRRAVSESSRYYKVVEKLPTIAHHTDSFSVREQLMLTSKNSVLLGAASFVCYLGIFFAQTPEWRFLDPFFAYFFAVFFVTSALFLVNVKSAQVSLLKMIARSSNGARYVAVGHFISMAFFFFLCAVYFWAYSFAPASLSVILVLPSLAFALRSMLSTFKAVSGSGLL